MKRHVVCKVDEVKKGQLTRASVGRAPVVLMRLPDGQIRAFAGRCPHQGAALEHGCVSGMTHSDVPNVLTFDSAGEVLRCPWHGFEFSLISGDPLIPGPLAGSMRLRFFKVEVDGDNVVVLT